MDGSLVDTKNKGATDGIAESISIMGNLEGFPVFIYEDG